MTSITAWRVIYFLLAGASFGVVLERPVFASGFSLAVGLVATYRYLEISRGAFK